MKRRDFVALSGGAMAWPSAAVAQAGGMRKVGVLDDNAPNGDQQRLTAFRQGLASVGWIEGKNVQLEIRSSADIARLPSLAADLVSTAPDAILAINSPSVLALRRVTHSIPIVFVSVSDPVRLGFVTNLARPGGNITGFSNYDSAMGSKWLQLLNEIAPHLARVVILFDLKVPSYRGFVPSIESAAKSAKIEALPLPVRSAADIQRLADLGRKPGTGLIVLPSTAPASYSAEIIKLALRLKLPAIYATPLWTPAGGLMSYNTYPLADVRRAASEIDRILRGAKPADLPVQNPTKYQLTINLKTAKAMGLTVPQSLLVQADQVIRVKRRDLIALLGAAAVGGPVRANAQTSGGTRRIGLLLGLANDRVAQGHVATFRQGLQALGWTEGRNVHFDYRWAGGDPARIARGAQQLGDLAPDVILVYSTPALAAMKQQTQTIPIVFVQVTDPVSEGLVSSLGHPGGNVTGFMNWEFSIGGKCLQLLKEFQPRLTRVALIYNPHTAPGGGLPVLRSIQAGARSVAVEVTNMPVRSLADIGQAMSSLRESHAGVVLAPDVFITVHRREIGQLAVRYHLPAISSVSDIADAGVLMSYGADLTVEFRQAASYVDRILRGAKPADLPVQSPTAFDFTINLKTAKALGLAVPQSLLIQATEVIR